MKTLRTFSLPAGLLLLPAFAGCVVGPRYQKPDVARLTPADWHWKIAEPNDALPKGAWWELFNDPELSRLERAAAASNQTLRAAVARVDQARAVARLSRSEFFPEISLDPSYARQRISANQPIPLPVAAPRKPITQDSFSVPLDLRWELDLWGRVRHSLEGARAQAEASAADYHNVLLTLQADVAVNYFALRALDASVSTLRRAVELRRESATILQDRFSHGLIPEIDAVQARAEAAQADAALADAERQRTERLYALALLCGQPASQFEIAASGGVTASPVAVPAGLPSALLERRPDIAAAERRLFARNAQIGVARSAYFPSIALIGSAGFLSAAADNLFSDDSRAWSIGPRISLPLFNAGRTKADAARATAAYDEALADYRQSVLVAFKDVEDALAQIALRARQASAQAKALAFSRQAAGLAKSRYEAGIISYLEVATAERAVLQQERQSAQIEAARFAASVHLIKALGGGWQKTDEPAGANPDKNETAK
jgi:multidrug efflux system outer membrane protein